MRKLNKDQAKRDKILGISNANYPGGCEHFSDLTLEKFQELIDNDFIELDECQNDSPSVREFYNFLKKHPEFTAHGYAIEDRRDDYRVSIEGIECHKKVDENTFKDFVRLCRLADDFEFENNNLYAWWD